MDRRTFMKATSAAIALFAVPTIAQPLQKLLVVDIEHKDGTYMRFPNGEEFVLVGLNDRAVPKVMEFMATHVYKFGVRGGMWTKNRWPVGSYPRTKAELQHIRRVTREDLLAEGIMYRVKVDDEEIAKNSYYMSMRVNKDRLVDPNKFADAIDVTFAELIK